MGERPGAELQGQGGVEVKIDKIDRLDLHSVLDRVKDLAASCSACSVSPAGVYSFNLGDGPFPFPHV